MPDPTPEQIMQQKLAQQAESVGNKPTGTAARRGDPLNDPLNANQLSDPIISGSSAGQTGPTSVPVDPSVAPVGPVAPTDLNGALPAFSIPDAESPDWLGAPTVKGDPFYEQEWTNSDGSKTTTDGSELSHQTPDGAGGSSTWTASGDGVSYGEEYADGSSSSIGYSNEDGVTYNQKGNKDAGDLSNTSVNFNQDGGKIDYANSSGNGAIVGYEDGKYTVGLNRNGKGFSGTYKNDETGYEYGLNYSDGDNKYAASYGYDAETDMQSVSLAAGNKKLGGHIDYSWGNDQYDVGLGAHYRGVGLDVSGHLVNDRLDQGEGTSDMFDGHEVVEASRTNELGGGGGIGLAIVEGGGSYNSGDKKTFSRLKLDGEDQLPEETQALLDYYDVKRLDELPDDVQDLALKDLLPGEMIAYEDYDQYTINAGVSVMDAISYDYDRQGGSSEKTTVANTGDTYRVKKEEGEHWSSTHAGALSVPFIGDLASSSFSQGEMDHQSVTIEADANNAEAVESAEKFAQTGLLPGAEDITAFGYDVEALMEQLDARIRELKQEISGLDVVGDVAAAVLMPGVQTKVDELARLEEYRETAIGWLNGMVADKFKVGEEMIDGVYVTQSAHTDSRTDDDSHDYLVYGTDQQITTTTHVEEHMQSDGSVGRTVTTQQSEETSESYLFGLVDGDDQKSSNIVVQASNAEGFDGLSFVSTAEIEDTSQVSTAKKSANSNIGLGVDSESLLGKDLVTTVSLSQDDLADIASRYNEGDDAGKFWKKLAWDVAQVVENEGVRQEILKVDSPGDFQALPDSYQELFVAALLNDIDDNNPFQAIAAIELMDKDMKPDVYADMVETVHEKAPDGDVGTLYNQFLIEMNNEDMAGQDLVERLENRTSVKVTDETTKAIQGLPPESLAYGMKTMGVPGILKVLETARGQGGAAYVEDVVDATGWTPQEFSQYFFTSGGDRESMNQALDLLHGTYYGQWFQDALDALSNGAPRSEVASGEHSVTPVEHNRDTATNSSAPPSAAASQTDRWGKSVRRYVQQGDADGVIRVLDAARAKGNTPKVQAVLVASGVPHKKMGVLFLQKRKLPALYGEIVGTPYCKKLKEIAQAYMNR